MILTVGEIISLSVVDDVREAKVRIRAAFMTVPLLPQLDVQCGDYILIESGIGIAKFNESSHSKPV